MLEAEYGLRVAQPQQFFSYEFLVLLTGVFMNTRSKRILVKLPIWQPVSEFIETLLLTSDFNGLPWIYYMNLFQMVVLNADFGSRENPRKFVHQITSCVHQIRNLAQNSEETEQFEGLVGILLREVHLQTGDEELLTDVHVAVGIPTTKLVEMFNENSDVLIRGVGRDRTLNVKCWNCGMDEGEPDTKFKKCSRCKLAYYCSRGCQKSHWKKHKPRCLPVKE